MEPPKGASDALLSCPACLATLCVDCQRHVSRRNQFRAMFARNVRVATDVLLRPQEAHNAAISAITEQFTELKGEVKEYHKAMYTAMGVASTNA